MNTDYNWQHRGGIGFSSNSNPRCRRGIGAKTGPANGVAIGASSASGGLELGWKGLELEDGLGGGTGLLDLEIGEIGGAAIDGELVIEGGGVRGYGKLALSIGDYESNVEVG